MIRIHNLGEKISYTKDDTFELEVNSDNFETGDTCLFIIAENENAEPVIRASFALQNGSFTITLTEAERDKLNLGNYIYKIVITSLNGEIITQKSGNFLVKWGA